MNIKLYLTGILKNISDYMAGDVAGDDQSGVYNFLFDKSINIFWIYGEYKPMHAALYGADIEIFTGAGPRVILELRDYDGDKTAILKGYAKKAGREFYGSEDVPEDITEALFNELYTRHDFISIDL